MPCPVDNVHSNDQHDVHVIDHHLVHLDDHHHVQVHLNDHHHVHLYDHHNVHRYAHYTNTHPLPSLTCLIGLRGDSLPSELVISVERTIAKKLFIASLCKLILNLVFL